MWLTIRVLKKIYLLHLLKRQK